MSEKLPWQKFFLTAKEAGYRVELPRVNDRLDFRVKLKKYMELDARNNAIRPVYINGKEGQERDAFFSKWYSDNPERAAEETEIKLMMHEACLGQENMALNFTHYKSPDGVLDRVAEVFEAPFLRFGVPLNSVAEDRLVATFLKKAGTKKIIRDSNAY